MIKIEPVVVLVIFCIFSGVASDSETSLVKAEFERSVSSLEKAQRAVSRYESSVQKLQRNTHTNESTGHIYKFEEKIEYFHNRIDRLLTQKDKLSGDLQNVHGPTCPSCVASGVDLFRRTLDMLIEEIEQYQVEVSSLSDVQNSSTESTDTINNVQARLSKVNKSMHTYGSVLDSCPDAPGKSLWKQCRINYHTADSLYAAGFSQQADKALDLTEILLERAVSKCGNR